MPDKLIVGPINKGLKTDREPFVIDNDSFPVLTNAYQWRGRVKRKRGTSKLGRLLRSINSSTIQTDGAGNFNGNLLTGLETNATLAITQITIGVDIFTLTNTVTGALTGSTGGSGTINYATGALTITGAPISTNIQFNYYPGLPVMGLEDLDLTDSQFSLNLAFDTKYSYNISPLFPYTIYDVSYFKNVTTGTYSGYTQKTTTTPVTWNGQDYQQFWTVNYQNCLWATNGTNVPFNPANVGMPFKLITGIAITTAGNGTTIPAVADLTIAAHGLVVGDFVFINEVNAPVTGINWQTGYVTTVVGVGIVTVTFPRAILNGVWVSGGIAQYLTNRSSTTLDCIRWYDGDPTTGVLPPVLNPGKGWVNFCPPLSQDNYSIADAPPAIYYLVGARLMLPFKDRLLFFGPVIQTSGGTKIYLQDTVVYSQNGTPFYTVSYPNDPDPLVDTPTSPTNNYLSLLVPVNQTATPSAWFEDSTGFGGFISAGVQLPIVTVSPNEDVLLVEFDKLITRLVDTGNDITPFNFFLTNSEYGCGSTFSVINMDDGVLSRGKRGFIMANQVSAKRFDLDIPDQAFEINLKTNGSERVTAHRDFINEWIYFTYCVDNDARKYPNQTLFYNYRDESWGIFNESYTTYGSFRRQTGLTWATVGQTFPTWKSWNAPWNSGSSTLFMQQVIGGNQQGFVIIREDTVTSETPSLFITAITNNIITSPNHNLQNGDYIVIENVLGTVGALVNGNIYSAENVTTNTFVVNPLIAGTGTYLGGGTIKLIYVPYIQTKQFPEAWGIARKTRIGVQQYLLTTTDTGQIQLLIFLSQNGNSAYNEGSIVPTKLPAPVNDGLIYSTVLYTCPESTNLGLTPANINLQMVTAKQQSQIWHRINTSLIGDTIQLGFTLSDAQVRDNVLKNYDAEIELHGFTLDVSASMNLA